MNKGEPPSLSGSDSSLFLVGKDSHGNWVVQDQSGLCGGLFVGRAEALKFAMFENGHRPQAVIMVPGVLELDMSANPNAGRRSTTNEQPLFSVSRRQRALSAQYRPIVKSNGDQSWTRSSRRPRASESSRR